MLNYKQKEEKNLKNPLLLAAQKINLVRKNYSHQEFSRLSTCIYYVTSTFLAIRVFK